MHKGTLTVIKQNPAKSGGGSMVVKCECGNEFTCYASRWKLYTGKGCNKCVRSRLFGGKSNPKYRHGGAMEHVLEMNSYRAMNARCYDTKYVRYDLYGGRGIKVCERWRGADGFANFLADMGKKPTKKHSLDRINREGDYTPENCRWATQKQQMNHVINNRKITIDGVTKNLAEWCEIYGIKASSAMNRVRAGMSYELAVTTPLNKTGVNFKHRSNKMPRAACVECGEPTKAARTIYCSRSCYLKRRWNYTG